MLVDTPTGGRGFVPEYAWSDTYFDELPNIRHPQGEHVHHSGVIESLFASAAYITKGPLAGIRLEDVPFIVSAQDAMSSLTQYQTSGSLRS